MKSPLKSLLPVSFLLFLSISTVFSQKNTLQQSIYFESAKFDLSKESQSVINALVDSLNSYESYSIVVKGNTDDAGDSIYNQKLSEQRVNSTRDYFLSRGIKSSVFKTKAEGELKPIANNQTAEGKQKNRRVDITITYHRKVPVAVKEPELPSIRELYKLIEIKPQEFCINPEKDTILRCEKGTLISIKANSFKRTNSCKTGCVTIKVKEDFKSSEMFMDNLATMSNGRLLESQGMIYTEANDCTGKKINLAKNQQITVLQPVDTIIPGMKLFEGNRDPHSDEMNWTLSNNASLSNFSFGGFSDCMSYWNAKVPDYECERCKFFFCRIGRIDDNIKARKNESIRLSNQDFNDCQKALRASRKWARKRNQKLPEKGILPKNNGFPQATLTTCESLEKLFKQYGVDNISDLITAINAPLMEKYGVKTFQELQDTLAKVKKQEIEESIANGSIPFKDLQYYIYSTPKLGWKNVDAFANIPASAQVTMHIKQKPAVNVDCKLVFRDQKYVIPAQAGTSEYTFTGPPKGKRVWIVVVKYLDQKPYLSMTAETTANDSYEVNLRQVTLEELKKELEKLDN